MSLASDLLHPFSKLEDAVKEPSDINFHIRLNSIRALRTLEDFTAGVQSVAPH